jgi:hypothetical protein
LKWTAADEQPDLILLTETWCNALTNDAELQVDGYQLEVGLRRDRSDTTNGIGGGLLVYTKSGTEIKATEKFKNSNFNQFFCEFQLLTRTPLNFIVIYRPPNSGIANIEELCGILHSLDKNTIIIGDLNLPEIDWAN